MLFELGDKGIGRAAEQCHQFAAIGGRRTVGHLAVATGFGPVIHRRAGNGDHVVAGLLRHRAGAGEPFLHPPRAGIVGRGRQSEIAELRAQFTQKFRGFRQRLHRVEGIEQPALAGGSRHELRDALRALAAARDRSDGVGLKAAFLPDHAGEKLQRQIVRPRRRFDHQAHRLAGVGFPPRGRGVLRPALVIQRDREFFDARPRDPAAGIRGRGMLRHSRRRQHKHRERNAKRSPPADQRSHCRFSDRPR